MALVSVLLPVCNGEAFLADALESIRLQSLRDIEVIVVDDNSTDASYSISQSFERRDARFKAFRASGRGIVSALNQAQTFASAAVIARMDADDISYPRRLELQYEYLLERGDVDLVSCCVEQVAEDGEKGFASYINWSNALLSYDQILNYRFVESPLIHPTVCFRKKLLTEFGPWVDGDFPEDYELWLRWLSHGVRMEKMSDVLLKWRDSEMRLTRQDPRYSRDAFFRIKSDFVAQWVEHYRGQRKVYIVGAGRRARKRVALLLAQNIEIGAWLEVDARRIGQRIDGVIVSRMLDIPSPAECLVLNYVGSPRTRDDIEAFLSNRGFRIGEDFMHIT
jgi:glycosyltransferase involved in cell wall biosynthesis